LAAIVGVVAAYSCPNDEDIEELGCRCNQGEATCTRVGSIQDLDDIARKFEPHQLKRFNLERSTLPYLLPELFKRIRSLHVNFKDNVLHSIRAPNLEGPFRKSKLKHLSIDNTTLIDLKGLAASMYDLNFLTTLSLRDTPIDDFNKIITELPNPEDLTELYIVNCGSLKMLSNTHKLLKSLTTLHLTYAGITTELFERMKASVVHLRTLSLHHNDIDSLEGMESSLEKLDVLDLGDNRIETVPERVLGKFKGTLQLARNPLACSKNLLWLKSKIESGDITGTIQCLVDAGDAGIK